MPFQKLSFYGDSLMVPRPGVVAADETHARLLEGWLRGQRPSLGWAVLQRARGGHTINEIAEWTASDKKYFADVHGGVAVVQSGIVDGAPRPVIPQVRSMIGRLPKLMRAHIIRLLHDNRARILRRGLGGVVTPLPRFESAARTILSRLCGAHDHVFVITICPTNPRMEEHSPGLSRNIIAYNDVWHRIVREHGDKARVIDVHSFMSAQPDLDRWLVKEDGHHITTETHRWIADEIIHALEAAWRLGGASPA
jgi:hypothetical protein